MRIPTGRRRPVLAVLAVLCAALAIPSAASALSFEIVNESGREPSEVFVTVAAGGTFEVAGMENDVAKPLSEIPGGKLEIEKLVSGRVFVAYGAPVTEATTLSSPTRFDWAELTVTPNSSDVANLTAVDEFSIGMRLDTYGSSDEHLESVGDANSNTIFNALQQIPGGPAATIREAGGNIIRILSPNKSSAYPPLTEYVHSMAGKSITLHTAFFGSPFTTSVYTGTFAADGTITLSGATSPLGEAPSSFTIPGNELIADIYTGGNTPNTLEGALKRDLLAGFSTGFWDGRYGNDAISFCSNPQTTGQGSWCPAGFNQLAFGDARPSLSSFPTCEQYAAVINQYSDVYGNPYSDAAKKVTVSLDQPGSGGDVKTLRLTILPDSGNAGPSVGGNPNCGAAPASPSDPNGTKPAISLHLLKKAKVKKGAVKVGRITCGTSCGEVKLIAKKGNKVIARGKSTIKKQAGPLKLKLTKPGKKLLAGQGRPKVSISAWVTSPGQKTVRVQGAIKLIR